MAVLILSMTIALLLGVGGVFGSRRRWSGYEFAYYGIFVVAVIIVMIFFFGIGRIPTPMAPETP